MYVRMNICMCLFIHSKEAGKKEKGRCSPSFPLGDPRRCLQLFRNSQSRALSWGEEPHAALLVPASLDGDLGVLYFLQKTLSETGLILNKYLYRYVCI